MSNRDKTSKEAHQINKILGNFQPAIFPVINNVYPLKDFIKRSLPAFACNMKKGVDFIVRKGFPYMTAPTFIISTTYFRQKFNTFFKEVASRRLTVHGVITSRVYTKMELIETLVDPNSVLPADIELHLNISVFENAVTEMKGKNIVEISKAVFGTDSPYIHKVHPANFKKVSSISELEELAEFNYGLNPISRGLLLVSEKGSYLQGRVSVLDTSIAIYSPMETVVAKIEYVNDSVTQAGGKLIPSADSLVFRYKHHLFDFDVRHLPISLRGHMSHLVDHLVGKSVIIEIINLPGQKRPIIHRLVRLNGI